MKNLERLVVTMSIKILGTGSCHPKNIVTNNDFKKIETSDEWIYSRTGIKSRYIAKDETTSFLAIEAAKKAIEASKIDVDKIGLVICATITPDCFTPCVASTILKPLGINRAMAFDINVACSGFVYGLNIASSLLKDGEYALVIGGECMSKILDFNDRSSCVLFGDGAGAVVLEKSNNKCFFYANSKTDQNQILKAEGLKNVRTGHTMRNFKLQMKGQDVFKFALESFDDCFKNMEINNLNLNDVDLIIPHQANKRIIMSVARRHEINEEKFYLNLEKYGNTSAGSIAIALDEAMRDGSIKPGMKVLLVGFGAGLSWGYCYLEI